MPAVWALLYFAGLYGVGTLAYEAGRKKKDKELDQGDVVQGVPRLPSCDPYLTLPTGQPGVMRIVRPHDPEWCIALGYHLQLCASPRARQRGPAPYELLSFLNAA